MNVEIFQENLDLLLFEGLMKSGQSGKLDFYNFLLKRKSKIKFKNIQKKHFKSKDPRCFLGKRIILFKNMSKYYFCK
jgi:hypothetical protein